MDNSSTPVDAEGTMGPRAVQAARVAGVALATVVAYVVWVYGSGLVLGDDPDRSLLYAFLPPLIVTAVSVIGSLVGTLFIGTPFSGKWRWAYGSVLLGSAVFWALVGAASIYVVNTLL
jgi:hypothetical protein